MEKLKDLQIIKEEDAEDYNIINSCTQCCSNMEKLMFTSKKIFDDANKNIKSAFTKKVAEKKLIRINPSGRCKLM